MYQTCIVVGHLGRDPELRYTPDGTPVCSFSIATSRRWTDRNGDQQEKTTWFRVSAFGRQAETSNQYLRKGRLALVEGEVDVSSYMAQDGTPRASLELRARTVRFLGSRGEGGEEWPQSESQRFPAAGRTGSRMPQAGRGEDWLPDEESLAGGGDAPADEDEIPF